MHKWISVGVATLVLFFGAIQTASASSNLSTSTAETLQSLVSTLETEVAALQLLHPVASPAPLKATAPIGRPLAFGDEGTDVTALQQILKTGGFYTYPAITGYFGSYTWKAVAAFQWANGLDSVGYVGPKTRALLNGIASAPGNGGVVQPAATSPSGSSPTGTAATTATSSPSSSGSNPLFPVTAGYGGGGGGISSAGGGGSSPAPDTTPPTVSLTAPTSGATVSGSTVALTATASDNGAVANVQFKVDGANIGSAIASSPYTTTWNSTGVSDGAHTVYAVAEDTSDNYATSSISVTVDNTPPVISAISSGTPTTTSATITWTTNEAATSSVRYGLTSGYGSASSSAALVTSHSITLTGLSSGATYHFQVGSADGQGNLATSSDQTFTTPINGVWRGLGQAMSSSVVFGGGGSWSNTTRSRHYSNSSFCSFRVVLQTFAPTGGNPIIDTNFANNYNFEVGFEYPYVNADTGIPARIPVTFGGATTTSYTTSGGPFGYIESDPINLGYCVPAGAFFGLWTTVENAAGTSSSASTIPSQRLGSNFLQRYIGVNTTVTSQIAANFALTASSITPFTSTQAGVSNYFTPAMMLIDSTSSVPTVVTIGDSIAYGTGDGNAGSGSNGDSMGDALGNPSFISSGVYENVGDNDVNLARGSDGNKYLQTASNWTYRKELMVLANPSYVIDANIHNDIAGASGTTAWVASTAYANYAVVSHSSNMYMVIGAGTSGSIGPTGTSSSITDGTVTWAWVAADPGTGSLRVAYSIFGLIANVNAQIKAAVPGVKIVQMLATPASASTDSFATIANQTVQAGWGTSTSTRGLIDAQIRAMNPLLGISSVIDPNIYLEYNWPTSETSFWNVNGTADYLTVDGTHPNSTAAMLAKPSITSSLFQ